MGLEWVLRVLGGETIPCLILKHDTPEYILTQFASNSNQTNVQFAAMTWMDSVLNLTKFAINFTQYQIQRKTAKSHVWACQMQGDLHQAYLGTLGWSDFQKKMGFATCCCTRTDAEALVKHLAYRHAETSRTMFIVALLMDELNWEDMQKFRAQYRKQLGTDFNNKIGDFNQAIHKSRRIFGEHATYPGLFTSQEKTTTRTVKEKNYLNPPATHSNTLIMKCYLVIGRWIMNPEASPSELKAMREEISNYLYTGGVLEVFIQLLAISEPAPCAIVMAGSAHIQQWLKAHYLKCRNQMMQKFNKAKVKKMKLLWSYLFSNGPFQTVFHVSCLQT